MAAAVEVSVSGHSTEERGHLISIKRMNRQLLLDLPIVEAVRDSPIINDVTYEDAILAGMDRTAPQL